MKTPVRPPCAAAAARPTSVRHPPHRIARLPSPDWLAPHRHLRGPILAVSTCCTLARADNWVRPADGGTRPAEGSAGSAARRGVHGWHRREEGVRYRPGAFARLVGMTSPYNWYRQGQSRSRANGQPRNLHVHIAAHTCDRGPGRLRSIPCVHKELRIMLS